MWGVGAQAGASRTPSEATLTPVVIKLIVISC